MTQWSRRTSITSSLLSLTTAPMRCQARPLTREVGRNGEALRALRATARTALCLYPGGPLRLVCGAVGRREAPLGEAAQSLADSLEVGANLFELRLLVVSPGECEVRPDLVERRLVD